MNITEIINQLIDAKISRLKQDSLDLAFLRLNQKIDKIDNILHLKDVDSYKQAKEELKEEFQSSIEDLYSKMEDNESSTNSNESDIHSLDLRIDDLKNTLEELNLIDVKCLNDRLEYKCEHYDVTINALEKENALLNKRIERMESFFHQIGNYFDLYNDVQNDLKEDEQN